MPISVGPYSQAEINAATVNVSASASDVNTFGAATINIGTASFAGIPVEVTTSVGNPVEVTGTVSIAGGISFSGSVTALNNSVSGVGLPNPLTATLIGGYDDSNNVSMIHVDTNGAAAVYISSSDTQNTVWVTSSQAHPLYITGSNMGISGTISITGTVTTIDSGSLAIVDPNNSFSGALGSGSVWFGTAVDVTAYASIQGSILTDQASGPVYLQFSPDGNTWTSPVVSQVPPQYIGGLVPWMVVPRDRFFRVVYTNGPTGSNTTINTFLNRFTTEGDVLPVDAPVPTGFLAAVTKAVLVGRSGTTLTDVVVDSSGALLVHGSRQPTDNYPNPTQAVNVIGLNMVWDSDAQLWVRVGKGDIDADADLLDNVGLTKAESYVKVFNGSNFDRMRGDTTGTWVKITDSVPLSATISGTVPVSMTNFPSPFAVTSTLANPVWTTSSNPNNDLKKAADNAQYVTSSQALPVWVTGSVDAGARDPFGVLYAQLRNGSSNATIGSPSGQSAGPGLEALVVVAAEYQTTLPTNTANRVAYLEVDQNGRLYTTLSGTVVAVSQTNVASQTGLVGVTGAVQVSNTTGTLNVSQTGAFVVTGTVTAAFTGTQTVSQSNPVLTSSVTQTGSWQVAGTVTAHTDGLVGVSGTVAITSGVLTSITNPVTTVGLQGVTGTVNVVNSTGALNVSQTGSWYVTSSAGNPLFVTGTITTVQSATGTFVAVEAAVTGIGNPVPASATYIGARNTTGNFAPLHVDTSERLIIAAEQSGAFVITGTVTAVTTLTGVLPVSQTNPVALTGVSVNGLVGVSGTVAITSGTVTAHVDGLVGVSGTVAITSGTITSITNTVTVTGNLTTTSSIALTGALPVSGLVGVSGTVAVTSGTVTAHADGLVGVTGAVAITSGVLTSITNPVTVTSSFTAPVYVSSTIANPVMVSGVVTINTTGTLTVSQSNMPNVLVVTSALGSPVFVTSTITNPVVITASQASPVTVATTGTWPVTGTVTLGLTSSIVTVGLMGVTGTVTVNNSSGTVLNVAQTGTWIVGGTVTASFTGTQTVSQSNPVLTASVTQTGSWVVTGSVTTNVVTASVGPSAIAAAAQTVTMPVGASQGIAVTVTGTWNGTLGFYASFDGGTNWWPVEAYGPSTSNELVSSTTTVNGVFVPYDIAGATHVRVSATLWSTGQAGVSVNGNNHQTIGQISMRENGSTTPSYGVQIAGNDGGTMRFIKVDQSGALYVSSSFDRPVWVSGTITSVAAASGVFVAIENSVGGVGNAAPISATLIGGNNGGNLQNVIVDSAGRLIVTGTVNTNQTASLVVTSTQAQPVWVTGAISTTAGTQVVTSSQASPVWVTSTNPITATFTGTVPVFLTGATVNQTGAWSVALTGGIPGTTIVQLSGVTVNQTAAWVVTGTQTVTASQGSPVTVAFTGVLPVTGTVTLGLTSSLSVAMTGVTVNQTGAWQVAGTVTAHADGLVGVSGTVAVTSGVLTSITNPVVVTSAFASPVYVSSTSGNPVNTVGLHGVSGTVAITSGVLTSITNPVTTVGLMGVSGTVAITSGVLTSITNPVQVTSTQATPVWITGTLAGVSGNVNVVVSGATVNQTGSWVVSSTLAAPLWVTASSANPVFIGTTGTLTVSQSNTPAGTQVVTSTQAAPVWITSSSPITATFTGTVPVFLTGVTVNQTATWQTALTGVTVNQTATWQVALTGATVNQTGTWIVSSTIANPVNVTASSANPVSVTIVGGSSAGKQYLTGTDLNGGTGTLMIGVDAGNVARAAFMTTQGFLAVSQTNAGTSGGGTQYGTGSAPANMTGTVSLAQANGTVVALTATALGVQYVTISGAIDAVFSGTQIVTSTLANPVWITGSVSAGASGYGTGSLVSSATGTLIGGLGSANDYQGFAVGGNNSDGEAARASGVQEVDAYLRGYNGTTFDRLRTLGVGILQVSSTIAAPVNITGVVTLGLTASLPITSPVTVTSTVGNAVYVTSTQANPITSVGLHGVSGTVAITSGVLTSITNAVVVTSTQANPTWITGTLAGVSGNVSVVAPSAIAVTGTATPGDTVANPTTALLAEAFGMQWDGTQWVRARGGVSGTLVQTKPAATTTVTQVSIPGNAVTTLLAANTNRLGASIQSVASAAFAVHVKLGSAATLASYTVRVAQNGYYEVPANYNGIITGICSGSQAVQVHVTEITQ